MMIQPPRMKQLLRRMIDIYSPSGKENDLLDYLKGYLKRRGVPAVAQPVDESRYNLLVLPDTDDIQLALIGHLDTVYAYDIEDYGFNLEGDQIRGLGSADMKSGCAAMIESFLEFQGARNFQAPVALCLVVGEEENGDGADKLTDDYHFPWAIVGEPTDLIPCLSCYGYMEIQMASTGKRVHASIAGSRQNATETLLHMMLRVSQFLREKHPEVVYNFRDLHSNPSGFSSPDRCEAWLDIHAPADAPIGEIVTALEEVSLGGLSPVPEGDMNFHIETIDAGYRLPEKGSMVETLKTTYEGRSIPWETAEFRSHSDANQLWTAGIKPVVLGPGRLEDAHAIDESISFDQVCRSAEIYLELMQRLFV